MSSALSIRNILFPTSCLFCHTVMTGHENSCCSDCLKNIQTFSPYCCERCGIVMPSRLQLNLCGACLQNSPVQETTHSLYIYHGAVRNAVLAWKLQGQDAAILWLLSVASKRLRELIHPDDLLLPVPMPLSRMRKQGQHHAADLCRHIAQHAGCSWDWRVLRRNGEQARQSALSGAQRKKNLRKAFSVDTDYWQQQDELAGRIWVIDDIITTGMTLHFASKALRSTGKKIHALSLTRTVKGG
ncbi:MAG: ComF family protein [Mariprofundaceae bacterium]|nr:ComF family protein [Mariprofundaceae bacterium]